MKGVSPYNYIGACILSSLAPGDSCGLQHVECEAERQKSVKGTDRENSISPESDLLPVLLGV